MRGRFAVSILVSLSFAVIVGLSNSGCSRSPASAEASSTVGEPELEPLSITKFTDKALLFMEFPPLVKGEPAKFLAHLSVLETGEPVRSGRVTLTIGARSLAANGPKRDGLFVPEDALPEAGIFAARLTVASDQLADSIDLGEIRVHASAADARAAVSGDTEPEPTAAIPFLMEQQWKIRLLLSSAQVGSLTQRLAVPAQVIAPEGASAQIAAPAAGRIIMTEGQTPPRTGDRVKAGQVLAMIELPLDPGDAAQLHALRLELEMKVLDAARDLAECDVRLRFAEREKDRIAKLRGEGLATEVQLNQAEQQYAVAASEHESASVTRELVERFLSARPDRTDIAVIRREVTSPIAGVLTSAGRVAGEAVSAGDLLFTVLDDSTVWLEGRVSEFDLARLGDMKGAEVAFPAIGGSAIDVESSGGRLIRLGQIVDPASRTLTIRYELPNTETKIRVGTLAELRLAVARRDDALVVPEEAIIVDQGKPVAFVMLEGETFQRREVEIGLRDAGLIEVVKGISAGERIATQGAYEVKLAALSPASFGPGHQH